MPGSGGPTYLGAMACHSLDAALMIAISAWLLDKILLPGRGGGQGRGSPGPGGSH